MKILFITSGKGKNVPLACVVFYRNLLKIDVAVASHSISSTGEAIAKENQVAFYKINSQKEGGLWEEDLISKVQEIRPYIIFLLYNRIIPKRVLDEVETPIINIHPSILPAFKGLKSADQAIQYGCQVTGVTAHLVDETLDGGRPIIQSIIPITNTVKTYFDLEKEFNYHSAAITLQLIKWLINKQIQLKKDHCELSNPAFNISSFFPNLEMETEAMVIEYFKNSKNRL